MQINIRPARPNELPPLQELMRRSKAYWGYDESFLAAVQDELTLPPNYLATTHTFVLLEDHRLIGFYGLRVQADEATLVDLFIEPGAIGKGYGKYLWQHAVETARSRGAQRMHFESDPHAEPFYLKMGARRVRMRESTLIPGRKLPQMCFELNADRMLPQQAEQPV